MQWSHPALDTVFGIAGHYISWIMVICGLGIFGLVILKRCRLMRMGRPDPRFSDIGQRVTGLIKDGFLQQRQPRYLLAGVLHLIIFWGFLVLALHSIDLIIGGLKPGYELPFMDGLFGAFYNTLKDIFVLVVFAACAVAVYRRAILKPERYQGSHQLEAYLVLGLIAFLMITDMFYEGSRLASGHSIPGFPTAAQLAKLTLSGAGSDTIRAVNQLSYWLHLLCFFFFLNLLPVSKHFHIITGLPNVFFKSLHQGSVKPPQWDEPDLDQLDEAGVRTFSDFTWKHILDFYSCTECGRCTDNCPANAVGKPLSPKSVTMDLRDFGYRHSSLFKNNGLRNSAISGEIIQDDVLWACTTCGACERECPVFIEHIDKLMELRRGRVLMESRFPPEIEPVFRNMETYGNTWGAGPALRNDWARGLSVKTVQEDADIDLLFWVGCAGSFDGRSQLVAASFVKIMQKAGVNFAVLGTEENCCGDYARRTGNEYLFQVLAKKNIETLRRYNIRHIVTACPHGYNTLKNEYPQLGGTYEVTHATDFILGLIEEGRLPLSSELNKTITYHDPCYLGRHNNIFDAPRKILDLIPGVEMVEPEKCREKSFCCGAGGGQFWMESSGPRINDERTSQLLEKSSQMIATACPYCLIMLEDGIESKEMKGRVLVKDIIEVVSELL